MLEDRCAEEHHENPQREWPVQGERIIPRSASPLQKWLVKLIRTKWSLNGVGIDWRGCAVGFCAPGTPQMFDHPYNCELNADTEDLRDEAACARPCHQLPRATSFPELLPFSYLLRNLSTFLKVRGLLLRRRHSPDEPGSISVLVRFSVTMNEKGTAERSRKMFIVAGVVRLLLKG